MTVFPDRDGVAGYKRGFNNVPHAIPLRGPFITLVQAVKVAGLAASGGQAKRFVREGTIQVNGAAELRPGRKLVAGDRFRVGAEEWVIEP